MDGRINRAQFLKGAAALGAMAAAGPLIAPAAAQARPRGLTYRGVCYDTGTNFGGRDTGPDRPVWSGALMRGELRAIRERLHCGSVSVFGTDLTRLADTASEAVERGLHVWLQPRLIDHPQDEILEHLAATGRIAERLRQCGAKIGLNVGCEYFLFAPGIVPGDTWQERIEKLSRGEVDFAAATQRLNEFLARAATTARASFRGGITYAAAEFEQVDWRPFDFVGLDYYAYHPTREGHVRRLREFRKWRKPIVISEFGCCTFVGAEKDPGDGWTIVDWEKDPPELWVKPVRSERTQADHLTNMLSIFESEGLYSASWYSFISPDVPHAPSDPLHDLDMASYGLVKVIRERHDDPASRYRWEPKASFHALARHNAAH